MRSSATSLAGSQHSQQSPVASPICDQRGSARSLHGEVKPRTRKREVCGWVLRERLPPGVAVKGQKGLAHQFGPARVADDQEGARSMPSSWVRRTVLMKSGPQRGLLSHGAASPVNNNIWNV